MVQFSHPYTTTGKTYLWLKGLFSTKWCFCFLFLFIYFFGRKVTGDLPNASENQLTSQSLLHSLFLLFNTLSRFVITFLWRSKRLLISWLQSPSSDFGAQENSFCYCFHFSPIICHEVMRPDAMIFVFRMLSFKSAFSLRSVTFIKRLFSSSSLSDIRVVSSAYLRLLVFLPAILIPVCDSSSPTFRVMYFAQKLNNQSDNV